MSIYKYKFDINYRTYLRRIILIIIDSIIILFSLNTSFDINNSYFIKLNTFLPINLSLIIVILGCIIYISSGQYKSLTKYLVSTDIYKITIRNLFLSFLIYLFIFKFINNFNLNWLIIFWLKVTILQTFFRIIGRDFLLSIKNIISETKPQRQRVAIYGAGKGGAMLINWLRFDERYKITTFIDDNPKLWGRNIYGINIMSYSRFLKLKIAVDKILLAIPSIKKRDRLKIINKLSSENFNILRVPTLDELNNNVSIDSLSPISISDLLMRDPVSENNFLRETGIKDKIIFISGAGGSIGSELCRNIIKIKPKKIILLDNCEHNLYSIDYELKKLNFSKIEIIPILGDACNKNLIKRIFNTFDINIIFHAAAYKHVPLVECNVIEGIRNNVMSTFCLCEEAFKKNIQKFIFISSDKAVRPKNVMGASKRLSELIVQGFNQEVKHANKNSKCKNTIFAMVRFGNVLGSSGSVVPLFQKQIDEGGPITLTNNNVIRYFMTIPEASQLVLQASEFAEGGEVFLLDMGEPVKIKDLAVQMIKLNGLTVKNQDNDAGDIEIIETGLRPGEKLYEELLIDAKSQNTNHPLIYKANENLIEPEILWRKIHKLNNLLEDQIYETTIEILRECVPGWE